VDAYDLIINTGQIGYPTAAQMILCAVHDAALTPA
jgi:hypothetical protein